MDYNKDCTDTDTDTTTTILTSRSSITMPTKQDGQLSNFHLKRYEISLIPPPMSNYYARFERGAIIDRFFWYETEIGRAHV